jgi:hypothetical protein
MWVQRIALLALPVACACGDDSRGLRGDGGPAAADARAADAAEVAVARVLPWPGGGLQLVVELTPANGESPDAWIDADGARIDAVVEPAGAPFGFTAILVVPAEDADEQAARVATAIALVDALPDGERIAVLVARDQPVLVAELAADRAHARARIAALGPEAGGSAAALAGAVRDAVADLESVYTTPARSLIVVGAQVDEAPTGALRPVQTLSLVPTGDATADAAGLLAALAARRAALVRIGACAGLAAGGAFALHVDDSITSLVAPQPMDHLAAAPCDAADAAEDAYPFVDEIDLTFTRAERQVYDERVAGPSEEPFRTSVALGAGIPVPAAAHLRGTSSLYCERKSFSVTLDGPRRRLAPDLASDRFFLISMCADLRYFGQMFGDRLLKELGLFPAATRYVRLRIDGVNQGVYLVVHRPERALRDVGLGVTSVIRRRYDVLAQPAEVKYPEDPDLAAAALARFDELGDLAQGGAPETLAAELDARLDLDAYLRMLALYSLLVNGDYIDEAYFTSSLEEDAERYTLMGWDTDDLLSACHGDGDLAIADDCGLTYCAEAELDHALLRSPEVYRRYLEELALVLQSVTAARLEATMDAVQADLWAVLTDDETAAALTEMIAENPDAATVAGARADIAGAMAAALDAVDSRRAALADALASCPAAQ